MGNLWTARRSVATALGALGLLAIASAGATSIGASSAALNRVLGWRASLGDGEVRSFADVGENGAPNAVGIMVSARALAGLPTEPSDRHHCTDRDGDGVTAQTSECIPTHELVVPLPDAVTGRSDTPFKWALVNWNMLGHIPSGVYDVPHFDVHFYMTPIEEVFAIGDGTCGPEFVDCDDFATAKTPLADGLMHPDFKDVDAIVPAMGNHLIDLTGAEFNGEPFTRTWIYGMFDGRVTFYEEMVALAYLQGKPDSCLPIKSPEAVDVAGYYPTERCIRYDAGADAYLVSMERFVYREAR